MYIIVMSKVNIGDKVCFITRPREKGMVVTRPHVVHNYDDTGYLYDIHHEAGLIKRDSDGRLIPFEYEEVMFAPYGEEDGEEV